MKPISIVYLISLGILVAFYGKGTASAGIECPTGWFGPACQYKCHCVNNLCDSQGECTGSSTCEKEWFGPACQYVDLVQRYSITETPTWLSYDCVKGEGSQTVTVTLNSIFYFTWLRLRVGRPGISKRYNVQVSMDVNGPYRTCSKMKSASVNDTVLDIYCDPGVEFKQLILSGEGVSSLCSLYISGGRNVALKQNITQSSIYIEYGPNRAVDGNRDYRLFDGNCFIHSFNNTSEWEIIFEQPRKVSRYDIYINDKDMSLEKISWSLETYHKNGSLVFTYAYINIPSNPNPYFVISVRQETGVSRVKIIGILEFNLCEIEIFGDTDCEIGRYGRECENSCNCDKGDNCFVSSGGCPSGCATGNQWDACQFPCRATYYGNACTQKCSTNCRNQLCDPSNGTCLSCIPGMQGPMCDKACDNTYYGNECALRCSRNCTNQLCDASNGNCRSCIPGKQGPKCEEVCNVTYYGNACKQRCSTNCSDQLCDAGNGICQLCIPGMYGPMCDKEETNDEPILSGVIIGPIVAFVVLILVIIGVIIWRKHCHKNAIPDYKAGKNNNELLDCGHGANEANSESMTNEPGSVPHVNLKIPGSESASPSATISACRDQ